MSGFAAQDTKKHISTQGKRNNLKWSVEGINRELTETGKSTEQQRKLCLCGQEVSAGERTARGKTALDLAKEIKTNSKDSLPL